MDYQPYQIKRLRDTHKYVYCADTFCITHIQMVVVVVWCSRLHASDLKRMRSFSGMSCKLCCCHTKHNFHMSKQRFQWTLLGCKIVLYTYNAACLFCLLSMLYHIVLTSCRFTRVEAKRKKCKHFAAWHIHDCVYVNNMAKKLAMCDKMLTGTDTTIIYRISILTAIFIQMLSFHQSMWYEMDLTVFCISYVHIVVLGLLSSRLPSFIK